MVLLFISAGIIIGASSAGVVFWASGSLLLAILAYSCLGSIGALAVVSIALFLGDNTPSGPKSPGFVPAGRQPLYP